MLLQRDIERGSMNLNKIFKSIPQFTITSPFQLHLFADSWIPYPSNKQMSILE
jgi:hypothetical protein